MGLVIMEYKKYVTELDELTSTLAQYPQTVGLVHRFFVPGWIGFIQQCIVENKIGKTAMQPIYKNLNYYECGDKIADLTHKACEARKQSLDFKEDEKDNIHNLIILNSSFKAIEAWTNVYPVIAYWMNKNVDDKYVTCALNIVQDNVKNSLSEIMTLPAEKKHYKRNYSFAREMKAVGGQMASIFCNIIVLVVIAAIIGAIFG